MQNKKNQLKLEFKKEKINNYNENYEATLNNIYAATVMSHQIFARLGFQIKVQEEIRDLLKQLVEKK